MRPDAERGAPLPEQWLTAFPGLAIFVTVLAVNLLGDHLRRLPRPTAARFPLSD